MRRYLSRGGKAVVTGPSNLGECPNEWVLPSHPELTQPTELFCSIRDGVYHKPAAWETETRLAPSNEPNEWKLPIAGLYYHPHRMGDDTVTEAVKELCLRYAKPLPIAVRHVDGYFTAMYRSESGLVLHLLAKDYDTDIDHRLDEMRFHRSRVNYINQVEPIGIDRTVTLTAHVCPTVYTPFNEEPTQMSRDGHCVTLKLPEKTAYAILHFSEK